MIALGRAVNGISLNGTEWLLDDDDNIKGFADEEAGREFIRLNLFPNATDEELDDYLTYEDFDVAVKSYEE